MNYSVKRFKKIFSPKNVQEIILELNVHSITIDWEQKTFEVDYLNNQGNELFNKQSKGKFYKESENRYSLRFDSEDESDNLGILIRLTIEFTSIQEFPFFNGPHGVILKSSNEDILRRQEQKDLDANPDSEDEYDNFMDYEDDFPEEPDLNEDFHHMNPECYDDYSGQF